MSVPFQCLCSLGQTSIICAARRTSIHTFDLSAGPSHLSSWTHPLTKLPGNGTPQETLQDGDINDQEESEQPPSKKRRLDSDEKPDEGKADQDETGIAETAENDGDGKKKTKKQKQKKPKSESYAQRTELPFVILLTATKDGSRLIAVTGQDKTLWVFEHDGNGVLKELSRRVMPKRPSSISITADGETILSADKFGDVYDLPLTASVPSETADAPTPIPAPETTTTTATDTTTTPATKPAASRFTVHSKRNLRALEEQERMLADGRTATTPKSARRRPEPEHEPILGHVSMLTAVVAATGADDGRPYIVTADRDEHVRVSRGLPQPHVVETYCLGHAAFVAALCVPASRSELLVSAGGDDCVFLWRWRAGRLLHRADVLGRVAEVVPGAGKVAVSRLVSYDAEGSCYVLVICERVPAMFIFRLLQDTLEHVQTLNLPGNPLDATVVDAKAAEGPLRLAVAVHPFPSAAAPETEAQGGGKGGADVQSLLLFERDAEMGCWVRGESIADVVGDDHLRLSREELENVLYPVEKLRKTELEDGTEGPATP
ncbi:hypothetical protein GGR52DRAFT_540317 [Hypoxylon sp. FL1284]|nr:hypothetical protein GGR52DRAFT_540317 [Hypoxylon sp. FL1284]